MASRLYTGVLLVEEVAATAMRLGGVVPASAESSPLNAVGNVALLRAWIEVRRVDAGGNVAPMKQVIARRNRSYK